mmetsp:Transcript_50399/g.163092  ORF Transcript_50399/g.163092 Transcript_50399/m.163092 type:complete len:252 (+) Transcript_50399:524-1279(+)|eukprot:CAMPEP_0204078244 /NCGR_PEP_ID=MMETSP0360-20130528/170574_1 /ASSEMBLY_ACC=CAM_ASM_000342 /TAXON_ID=268821 /ORGANISM="Scrippsiella Hangoei, Strain SHTV-5" /LENGTH=251 /DNA_ID=CAMNT_0051026895 /DNA_START=400 /DNA_END=1155 /DNA_ORIENTATION=+
MTAIFFTTTTVALVHMDATSIGRIQRRSCTARTIGTLQAQAQHQGGGVAGADLQDGDPSCEDQWAHVSWVLREGVHVVRGSTLRDLVLLQHRACDGSTNRIHQNDCLAVDVGEHTPCIDNDTRCGRGQRRTVHDIVPWVLSDLVVVTLGVGTGGPCMDVHAARIGFVGVAFCAIRVCALQDESYGHIVAEIGDLNLSGDDQGTGVPLVLDETVGSEACLGNVIGSVKLLMLVTGQGGTTDSGAGMIVDNEG